jgi:hypothetical protein
MRSMERCCLPSDTYRSPAIPVAASPAREINFVAVAASMRWDMAAGWVRIPPQSNTLIGPNGPVPGAAR